jgi:DNA-binding MarR family transcriptional regulator
MSNHETAMELAQLIDRLDRLVRSGETLHGLNPAQWEALRYLSRANRFSRTPAALADYLGSTRGTVSQTLIVLEQKGHVARLRSSRDKRSIDLGLTESGRAMLAHDPLHQLAADLAATRSVDLAAIVALLREVLLRAIARNGGRAFGVCRTCRHFQHMPAHADSYGRCKLLDEPLSETDAAAICSEHVAGL